MSNDNSDFLATAETHGGLVKVSFAKPGTDSDGSRAGHTEKMAQVSDRVQLLDAATTHTAVQIGGDAVTPNADGSITSARTQAGMPRSGARITDDDLIDLGGLQVRIRDAVAAGVVVSNQDGSFSLAGAAGGAKGQSGKR